MDVWSVSVKSTAIPSKSSSNLSLLIRFTTSNRKPLTPLLIQNVQPSEPLYAPWGYPSSDPAVLHGINADSIHPFPAHIPMHFLRTYFPSLWVHCHPLFLFENIIILIFFISGQCFLEPFMIAGGMVKYHIQHQFDATLLCLSGKLFKIFHRTVTGINVIVILHIITVIILGDTKNGVIKYSPRPILLYNLTLPSHPLNPQSHLRWYHKRIWDKSDIQCFF